MRSYILIAGTALALSASPAFAGGPGGLIGGVTGQVNGLLGGTAQSRPGGPAGSTTNCLCNTVGTVTGIIGQRGHGGGGTRGLPGHGANVTTLVNSVVGLNSPGRGHGDNGHGQSIALAGTVTGSVNALTSMDRGNGNGNGNGLGLAGTVTGTVNAVTSINRGHGDGSSHASGRPLVNVTVANANGGMAGTVVNVSALNRSGSTGRSAVNVAALNGSGGTSGKAVNVSVLNGTATSGRSLINAAALNGTTGANGRLVNVTALNGLHGNRGHPGGSGNGGLAEGIRIINGIPCLPDGTPLTGVGAPNALTAISVLPGRGHKPSGGSPTGGGTSSTTSGSSSPPETTPARGRSASPTPTHSEPFAAGQRRSQVSH